MFLQNLTLIFLKPTVAGFTFVQDEAEPSHQSVHHKEVDVDRAHVTIPGRVEVRVECQGCDGHEVFNLC